ncbi:MULTISPECIES: type I glyceraldehyde-3-phosphate dehydrogenase [Candidatus Ichthyocystis]|uniref:Glyceraldehyde-3-phosphate dehydrogenase n=1 Tax=Candidatus Ichthyocystis hellenicum TaxID=1561003 RepID=A0A0S4M3R6_9BURK|nr:MULTISPECIES: type I glyceraldehyde-3-phosphate dehydrogenase [Ichthyocystis]CUT17612.1 Glyceraldehyde-3-phosphate dehydrogenase [Candidatus Ichthyocystis hellenicum]
MSKIRVAINGYGRIGRNVLKSHFEYLKYPDIEIVAVNDPSVPLAADILTRYDSVHGKFNKEVYWARDSVLNVDGRDIQFFSNRDPLLLPWGDWDIDVVFECTGHFTSYELASKHLQSGAKKVLISAPAGKDVDATVVFGVNHNVIRSDHTVISCASCTTNCLAAMVFPINQQFGIKSGLMTTIHSYTNDQLLNDGSHKDFRRARAAVMSMIPTKTGAAVSVGLVIPELDGKLDGCSVRVPTPNVSLVDLTFVSEEYLTEGKIFDCIKQAADSSMSSVLSYISEPLVSIDFVHDTSSCIFDSGLTKIVSGNCAKIFGWYDNEWGFCNRMLDTTHYWLTL